jgi:transposase-like protein
VGRPAKYPAEFRREAVELVRSSGRPIVEVARSLGITDSTLHNWLKIDREARERSGDPEALSDGAGRPEQPHSQPILQCDEHDRHATGREVATTPTGDCMRVRCRRQGLANQGTEADTRQVSIGPTTGINISAARRTSRRPGEAPSHPLPLPARGRWAGWPPERSCAQHRCRYRASPNGK